MSKIGQVSWIIRRSFSRTCPNYGKRNFRKFPILNKRGTKLFKQSQANDPNPEIPIHRRGVRMTGYALDGKFVPVPEMVPELIVPDLTGFKLKPYVSYKAPDVNQPEFTAEDLFNTIYARKIIDDFKEGKLDDSGNPLEPSPEEKLTAKEAEMKARQTGTDIFTEVLNNS